ncbi:hypothetical protein ACFLXQ_00965 [Chloroflexota bacterium]
MSVLIISKPGSLRDSLKTFFRVIPRIGTIYQIDDIPAALGAMAQHHPALVLLDANIFNGNSPSAAVRQLKAAETQSRCLVLADDERQQQQAQDAGADVSLLKGFPADKLYEVIEELLSKAEGL